MARERRCPQRLPRARCWSAASACGVFAGRICTSATASFLILKLPVVPGTRSSGVCSRPARGRRGSHVGQRVGVPWLGVDPRPYCRCCREARENLCESARYAATRRTAASRRIAIADARYVLALPDRYDDVRRAAPVRLA